MPACTRVGVCVCWLLVRHRPGSQLAFASKAQPCTCSLLNPALITMSVEGSLTKTYSLRQNFSQEAAMTRHQEPKRTQVPKVHKVQHMPFMILFIYVILFSSLYITFGPLFHYLTAFILGCSVLFGAVCPFENTKNIL